VSLRSLQPDSTGSSRLHTAYRFLYLNCWVSRSKIRDPTPAPQFPLPLTSLALERNVQLWGREERNSRLTSAQTVFYDRQEEDRVEKLQTTSSEELGDHLGIMHS